MRVSSQPLLLLALLARSAAWAPQPPSKPTPSPPSPSSKTNTMPSITKEEENNGRRNFLGKMVTTSSLVIGGTLLSTIHPEPALAALHSPLGKMKQSNNKTNQSRFGNNNQVYEPPSNSQIGKIHVITGATTGLGLESAKRIAAAGATVILTARSDAKSALRRIPWCCQTFFTH